MPCLGTPAHAPARLHRSRNVFSILHKCAQTGGPLICRSCSLLDTLRAGSTVVEATALGARHAGVQRIWHLVDRRDEGGVAAAGCHDCAADRHHEVLVGGLHDGVHAPLAPGRRHLRLPARPTPRHRSPLFACTRRCQPGNYITACMHCSPTLGPPAWIPRAGHHDGRQQHGMPRCPNRKQKCSRTRAQSCADCTP